MSVASIAILLLGTVVYFIIMWDVLKTTLSMHGGGPLTRGVMRVIDFAISHTHDKPPHGKPNKLVRYSNLVLTGSLFSVWFLGLLTSATVMLSSSPGSVTQVAESNDGLQWLNKLYFVGATLTTAGFGDFVPDGIEWQVLTIVMAVSGLVVTSLGISYVVSLVAAVSSQRAIARRITSLGQRPRDLLNLYFRDDSLEDIGQALGDLTEVLIIHTKQHMAYPAVHYVRADDDRDCLSAAIALLDETLTILMYDVPHHALPPKAHLIVLRRAITDYLESIQSGFIRALPEAPDYPDVSFLVEDFGFVPAGRARRLDGEFKERFDKRRRILRGATQAQGIKWELLAEYLERPKATNLDVPVDQVFASAELASHV